MRRTIINARPFDIRCFVTTSTFRSILLNICRMECKWSAKAAKAAGLSMAELIGRTKDVEFSVAVTVTFSGPSRDSAINGLVKLFKTFPPLSKQYDAFDPFLCDRC